MTSWTLLSAPDTISPDIQLGALLVHLGHHLGLFAIVIVLCSVLERAAGTLSSASRQILLGCVFGASVIAAMSDPIAFAPGFIVDARTVMIALAGPFAGPISAVVAALIGSAYRCWIGGAGTVPACASMAGVALVGVLTSRIGRSPAQAMGWARLAILALGASAVATLALFFLPAELDLPRRLSLPLVAMHSLGILVLGLGLGEQRRHSSLQRDLTATLDTERQLAERHRVITNNVADGIVTLDVAGIVRSFNSSAEWIFGSAAEEVIGRDVSVLMSDLNAEGRDTVIRRYLRTGKAQVLGANGTVTGRRRNGTTFPMELRIAEFRLHGSRYFTASVRDLTKARAAEERRAQAEAKLRDSEARFRDCAEASSDYLWESDPEHRFTSWAGRTEVADFYQGSVIGRTRWEVADADPRSEPWASHLACIEARQPFRNLIFSATDAGGSVRWIRTSGKPFFDDDGRFGGYRGASSDITDAVEAQRDLQVRAQQQQSLATLGQLALQDSATDGLFGAAFDILARTLDVRAIALFEKVSDEGDLVLQAGIGWCEDDLGRLRVPCSRSSLPGAAFLSQDTVTHHDIVPDGSAEGPQPGQRPALRAGMAAGIGDTSRRSGSLVVCAPETRRFETEERAFLDALASILGAAIERRRAEASLHLRDRALETIGQGLVIADATKPGAPAVYMNSVFNQARGGGPAGLLGCGIGELFASEDDPEIVSRIGRDLRDRGFFSGRMRTRHASDRDCWEDVTITRLCDERGALTHFVAVQTDVTHRVNMEAELLQAQKMDAVGKLTGGVAHDFNNLLTVILGNAELLVEELDEPQMKLTAEMVLDAAERGSDLVQRLLAFGRRQALQPEYLDLDSSLASLALLLRRTVGQDIRLETALASEGRTTFIDKSHLETAILNLVANARDAMKGGGTLTIATRPVEIGPDEESLELKSGRYLSLTVTDTGTGMPPEVRERVFEPFFTTKDIGKGTGLGLSTVYGFVQQSGGHVQVETEVGRGTSVEILLPHRAGPPTLAPHAAARSAEIGGERVLLVEDQDDVRSFVEAQLTSFGYDVVSAATAPAAIDILRRDPGVRLLFSDILLPAGPDGFELAECALVSRPDLKILFTSGYSDYAVERRSRLLDRGVGLLKKPYRRLELASAVREALDRPCVN